MPNLSNSIQMDYMSRQIMIIIIALIIGIGVINTLLMSVMERMKEFGVLKALGASSWTIWRLVLAESAVLGVLSVILGAALGILFNAYLVYYGMDLTALIGENMDFGGVVFDPLIMGIWVIEDILRWCCVMFVIALLSGVYPAFKANRIVPVKALNFD